MSEAPPKKEAPSAGKAQSQPAVSVPVKGSDGHTGQEHFYEKSEWWLVAATVALVYVTARLVSFTKKLWEATSKALRTSEIATLAAQSSANAAMLQAQAMEREFKSTHRPRIRIKHVWLEEPVEAGEPIMVRLVVVNTGDLTARITAYSVVAHAITRGHHPPNDPFVGGQAMPMFEDLVSGQTLSCLPIAAGSVTLDELGEIPGGSVLLYCFGYVDYTDAGSPPFPRKTSFCRVFDASGTERHAVKQGAFIRTPESERSEHNYAD